MTYVNDGHVLFQHLFVLEQREELCKAIAEAGAAYVGVTIRTRKDPCTFEQFQMQRLGKYRLVVSRY